MDDEGIEAILPPHHMLCGSNVNAKAGNEEQVFRYLLEILEAERIGSRSKSKCQITYLTKKSTYNRIIQLKDKKEVRHRPGFVLSFKINPPREHNFRGLTSNRITFSKVIKGDREKWERPAG